MMGKKKKSLNKINVLVGQLVAAWGNIFVLCYSYLSVLCQWAFFRNGEHNICCWLHLK